MKKMSLKLPMSNFADDIEKNIIEALQSNEVEFHDYFKGSIDKNGDPRYSVVEGSFKIGDLEYKDGQGVACGEFMYDYYAGCKDINRTGWKDVEIYFSVVESCLIIDMEFPADWVLDN